MSGKYFMGIDIGTTSSKGVIIDSDRNVVAEEYSTYSIYIPKPGWAEQDAESIWWDSFKKTSRTLIEKSSINPQDIGGVGVSALFPDMLPVDAKGKPLRNAILYGIDSRAGKEIEEIEERIGIERIFSLCGNRLTSQSVVPKILWFKKHEPEAFERTYKVLSATGYIVYKLTGKFTVDNTIASFFHPIFNTKRLTWNTQIAEDLGISPTLLPENLWSTEIAGYVTQNASKETGLSKGTTVIAGTGDALADMISAGAVENGDAIFMYGTTGCVFTTSDARVTHPDLWSFAHCLKGKYSLAGGMSTSGAVVRWFRDQFGYEELLLEKEEGIDAYKQLDAQAAKIPLGSGGLVLLPYFSGERTPIYDDKARGLIAGLTLSHTKAHLFRAVLEGVAYGFKHHVEAMESSGLDIIRVFATGGGAKSDVWRQIVSNVTGKPQNYVSSVGAPFGAACLAALGVGTLNIQDLQKVEIKKVTLPDQKAIKMYERYYYIYRNLYEKTKDEIHQLTELSKEGEDVI